MWRRRSIASATSWTRSRSRRAEPATNASFAGRAASAPAGSRSRVHPATAPGLSELRGEPLARAAAELVDAQAPRALLAVLRRLGARALALSAELRAVEQELERLLAERAAPLLAECGVGPITAAQLLVSSG